MNKVTFDIPRKEDGKWGSYISKYPADSGKVPANAMTTDTRNAITSATGHVEKRPGGAIWNSLSLLSAGALDQYEGIFGSTRLLIVNDAGTLKASTGNGLFSSITAGYANPANFEFATYQNRVYGCNGVDSPIVMDTTTSYGGVPYVFTTAKTKIMGAQAPGSAATAVRNVDSTVNQVPAGSHRYKITFVYYNGTEESNGSTASAICVNDGTHTSNALTAIPVGGYGVSARNIYRDNNDGDYRLLDTLPNNTATTYTDLLVIGSTPTPIPAANNVPGVFKYIALYLDRLFTIDVTGKNISWSIAGEPDVFDPSNIISGPQDDVMTAIYIFNGIPFVFGQHTAGTIQGTTDGTFYYSPLSTTVGCVDNRSIQTRSIVSVPTLLWLAATPNKGIYYTNGSVVQYLSDFIEDLTFNLAQISFLERSNTQASQAAFQSGTATPGIDLTSNPGSIETINPTAEFSHAADWAAGVLDNIAQISDTLGVPTLFAPTVGSGAMTGTAQASGADVTLASRSAFTGEGGFQTISDLHATYTYVAQPFIPPYSGTLTGVSLGVKTTLGGGGNKLTFTVWNDSLGVPGSVLYSLPNQTDLGGAQQTFTPALALTGGAKYWYGFVGVLDGANPTGITWASFGNPIFGPAAGVAIGQVTPAGGGAIQNLGSTAHMGNYTFTVTAIPASGTWTSPVDDTHSTSIQPSTMSLTITGTYPAGASASVVVQGSPDQSAWTTTDTLPSPNGTTALTGGTYRYWRVIISLSTTDTIGVPDLSMPTIKFSTTGTWTSAPISCTSDMTVFNALTKNSFLPAGTTATLTIATSALQFSGYSGFVALGSATPNVWAKIRVTMTTDSGNTTSPTLVSAELDWTVVSSLISVAIDTGVTPAGWGIFQYDQVGMTGTVAFYFRSASTSPGLAGASWIAVSNGAYPTSSALEFCQWKAQMTATVNNVPVVDSITVNWLLTSGANVRAASLFFNKSYYLSVATQGSTTNNLLIELDYEGNWRVHNGAAIKTMGLYFNDAFYGDASSGAILNAFKLPTDNGTPITLDLRTKCFDAGDNQVLKTVRSCKVTGLNTGTTIHVYYSVDRGGTWIEMLNSSGSLGYTTSVTETQFFEYFIPNFDGVNPTSGRNIIFRLVSSDALPCEILQISPALYVHKGKAITEAMA